MSDQGSRSYTVMRPGTRKLGGNGLILTYPNIELAVADVEQQYPDMKITAVIHLNLPDDTEGVGNGASDDCFLIQVYLGPKNPEKMTPEVRENTRLFWVECGFDAFALRPERQKGNIQTVIEALLADEIRPIDLCYLSEDQWDQAMSPYVANTINRQKMRKQFVQTLDCED